MNWSEIVYYKEGNLYWKERPSPKISKDTLVGWINDQGYRCFEYKDKQYKAHSVIFELFNGKIYGIIDHIDLNKSNNSIENLRDSTKSQNQYNTRARVSGKLKGISWHKRDKKWISQIQIKGKRIYLGAFDTPQEAHNCYKQKLKQVAGEFARYE
jgi:hypothetical protein